MKAAPHANQLPELNDIPRKQNDPRMLTLLQAKSALYDQAQWWYQAQFWAAAAGSLMLSVITVLFPQTSTVTAMASVVVAGIEHYVLDPPQERLRTLAARAQEMFDCELFSLPRRADALDGETVALWARKHPSSVGLRDWYSVEVGALPLPFARVVCQRASAYWSSGMRRRFSHHLNTFAAIVASLVVLVALATGQSLLTFFCWISTALPMLAWLVRESKRQADAANACNAVIEHGRALWERLIVSEDPASTAEIAAETRELQNLLYDQRRRDPQVFRWVYKRYRDDDERTMKDGIAELLEELRRRRPSMLTTRINA